MSAKELLKQVKALNPTQQAKLIEAVLEMDSNAPRATLKSRRVIWPDVERRASRILGKRSLPNLVLLERDEEAH